MDAHPRQHRLIVFERHLRRLEKRLGQMDHMDGRFFWARLSILILGTLSTLLVFFSGLTRPAGVLAVVWVIAFALVVFFHRRLDRARTNFGIARRLVVEAIARMRLDWEGIPVTPGAILEPVEWETHPFASDLQIAGARSLHSLIDTAISLGGSRRLLNWLLVTTPDLKAIQERQTILGELQPRHGFRRRLALLGALAQADPNRRWNGEGLVAWLERHQPEGSLQWSLLLLSTLALVNLALLALNLLHVLPPLWIVSLIVYAFVYQTKYREVGEVFSEAHYLSVTLSTFRSVLGFLERYPYPPSSRLSQLCAPFTQVARRPSRQLRAIAGIASAASLQNNMIIWMLLNAIVPWDLYFAYRLEQYKQNLRGLLPLWLDTWHELEALNSLANFAYLNPTYTVPEVRPPAAHGPIFSAQAIGHPMIPYERRVSNDFSIKALGELVIVTGSNMSGKSTFLRTLGVNLVLTNAGGAACARTLQTLPFRLFTSMVVSDSLINGISYFYAEVKRLKRLLLNLQKDAAEYPLFFLIDEIFRGTNNRERRIGSLAYTRALAGGYGAGVISTHDLELIHLEEQVPGIYNFHFREEVQGDQMVFDYRLRPGPCPTTNALKIMALEGLPVDNPASQEDPPVSE